MVWGWCSGVGLRPLVPVRGTPNASADQETLDNSMLQTLWGQFEDGPFLFQHDRTPVHRASSIKRWMSESGVEEPDWPAQSPDLHPIEHLWDGLERRLRARPSRPTSVSDLTNVLLEEWAAHVSEGEWQELYYSRTGLWGVSECFSALGESLSMQSATVTPASALEQNSQREASFGRAVESRSSCMQIDFLSRHGERRPTVPHILKGRRGFDCRCGNLFCGIHRYSDVHNCTFDYRAEAAAKIRKENPVVAGEKIQKI
ncbi:hypothetical protein NFI96_007566 [Prochilodus magdalenae]|nr:hypothetical protein NFI96_007566 [Prochilodus magdalenae]